MKRKTFLFSIVLSACLMLTGCVPFMRSAESIAGDVKDYLEGWEELSGSSESEVPVYADEPYETAESAEEETWSIYWYLCGSDLESVCGAATADLEEMMQVALPEGVRVVIETGGAYDWQNSEIDSDSIGRYVYDSQGLRLVDRQPQANMGDAETLTDFLSFCTTNYPADHTMVLFWNHGGGSISGAAFDENYGYDSLTLTEMYSAFYSLYDLSVDDPPFDVIGFDACLMATIDTAYNFCDIAKYLVASEESEPGTGWFYTGWLEALAADPGMDGAELGMYICDSYAEGCQMYGVADEITLSVTDLSAIESLIFAYEDMGKEALLNAVNDPTFISEFGRAALWSENYGGNTAEQGYANMVDLGHLAYNSSEILPDTAPDIIESLDECVLYKVNGPYREEATGLSCYYSYDGDINNYLGFLQEGCSQTFKYFYEYALTGSLSEEGMAYIEESGYYSEDVPEIPTLEGMDDFPVYVDDDGYVVLDVGPEIAGILKGVYFRLAYVDVENDITLMLGHDNDLFADWENGVFTDNFRGVWGAIDGHYAYMDIVYEGDDYNTYSVPILLNGEEYSLRVVYDFTDAQYYILGARKGLDETGMADKNLVQLQPGDEITTLLYAATVTGDDQYELYEAETFYVTEDTSFEETWMGDGEYMMMFELVDAGNNLRWSEPFVFTVEDGEIYSASF